MDYLFANVIFLYLGQMFWVLMSLKYPLKLLLDGMAFLGTLCYGKYAGKSDEDNAFQN